MCERLWLFLAVVWQTVKTSFIWNTLCLDYFLCISSLPLKLLWLLSGLLTQVRKLTLRNRSKHMELFPCQLWRKNPQLHACLWHGPLALEPNVSPGSIHGIWKPLRQPHSLVTFWSWEGYRVRLSLCLSLSLSVSLSLSIPPLPPSFPLYFLLFPTPF